MGIVIFHYNIFHLIKTGVGPFAVTGFFVLSGFLISLGMHREKPLDVYRFYSCKCRRLIPMFLVGLLLGCMYRAYMAWRHPESNPFIPGNGVDWGHFSPAVILYWFNGPLWYMGAEFAFLLTVPFLYSLSHMRWGLEAMFVGSALFSCFLFSRAEGDTLLGAGLYFSPIARFWQFMAGVVTARSMLRLVQAKGAKEPGRRRFVLSTAFFSLFLAAGMALILARYTKYTFSFDLQATLFCSLLIPFLYLQPCSLSSRVKKSLRMWSDMSYPVYLIHAPLHTICLLALLKFYGASVPKEIGLLVAACMSLILARLMLYGQKRYFSA